MSKTTECGTVGCAVGLAYAMGIAAHPMSCTVADAIGISRRAARKLFLPINMRRYGGVQYQDVTPAMVADLLEVL